MMRRAKNPRKRNPKSRNNQGGLRTGMHLLKQFEIDPVHTRKFRFEVVTAVVGSPTPIQVQDIACLLGACSQSARSLCALIASFQIEHISVSDLAGNSVFLELAGNSNSRSQEKGDTGTAAFPSYCSFSKKELKDTQTGWWWGGAIFTNTTTLFSVSRNATSTYLDLTIRFTLSNENASTFGSGLATLPSAGTTYVMAIDEQSSSSSPKWAPVSGYTTIT